VIRKLPGFLLLAAILAVVAQSLAATRTSVTLLISGGTVVPMDPSHRVIEDGAVAIVGDSIAAVGASAELEARFAPAERIDAHGQWILPGLINGHTHVPMVLFRGIAEDLPLNDWLHQRIFPAESRNVTKEFVETGTRLGILEMLRAGTTTYVDMYYFEDAIAEVTNQAGMRGVLGESVLDFPVPDNKTPADAFGYTERFIRRWQGDPLITPAVAPHSIYTCSEKTLLDAALLARHYRAPILIHLAESKIELTESRAKHGATPVAYLQSIGVLGPEVVAAHCIWVDAGDIATLARSGAGCVHNPSSNMKLASGVMPVADLLAAGVPVGLGTDGAASNNTLDLFSEMDIAAKLQKVIQSDPRALPAEQVLEMATIGGARALHMEKQIGSLEPGKKADIILLNVGAPHAAPLYSLYAQLVYAVKASDVDTVIIGGRTIMRHRKVLTLDEPSVIAAANLAAEKVRKSLAPH
jgi:5-methylthioadenosine/S-adenosylhomocysteine deaminase